MKKIILTSAILLLTACFIKAEGLPADTTFRFNRKVVNIEEDNDRIKVKVFEEDNSNEAVPYKQLYEGIFSDEKSYERWTVQETFGFNLPFSRKKKNYRMEDHWDGIGLGFANITDKQFNFTEVDGVSIKAGSSYEWFLNMFGAILPIYRNNLGITTGAGMSWLNLRLDKDTHLADVNGVTRVYPAEEDIHYSLSRLMVVRINIPLLLEWQPDIGGKHKAFFSVGIVGGVKTFSSFLIKYNEPGGKKKIKEKDRGLNTTPLSLDYMIQAGYGSLGFYAKYSPISLFQTNKGPDIKAVSLGLILHFD